VVRIVVLVPLYSVQSWLSLRFHDFGFYLGAGRDLYEAYVIFCFFAFLLAVQGGEERLCLRFAVQPRLLVHHPPPLKWALDPWPLGRPHKEPKEQGGGGSSGSGGGGGGGGGGGVGSGGGGDGGGGFGGLAGVLGGDDGHGGQTPHSPFLLQCQVLDAWVLRTDGVLLVGFCTRTSKGYVLVAAQRGGRSDLRRRGPPPAKRAWDLFIVRARC